MGVYLKAMIIEVLLSTKSPCGENNFAPMGMERIDETMVLVRPFRDSRTWANLNERGYAVASITDSILPLVHAVVKDRLPDHFPAYLVPCGVIEDPCGWAELELKRISLEGDRGHCLFEIAYEESRRPFGGFNRSRCAILEALVAATRIHVRGKETFLEEYRRAVELTERTGGEEERLALRLIGELTGGIG